MIHDPNKPKPIPIFIVPVGETEPTDLIETVGTVSGPESVIQWNPGQEPQPAPKPEE